jgi:excisionase family DNA binding protein
MHQSGGWWSTSEREASVEQKFIKLEEAVDRLGVSSERLNQLREQGEIRAYRDGSSWKFRTDEIDKLAAEGIPEASPPSDIGLVVDDDLVAAEPLEVADPDGDNELTLAGSDLDLSLESDSILLSEEQLGESATGSASTIIGKSELEDADLEIESEDSEKTDMASDVQLANDGNASHVLSSSDSDSNDVLGSDESESKSLSAFEDLDELEIDLAVESSRILSPDDVTQAQAAARQDSSGPEGAKKKIDSDLQLDDLELVDSSIGQVDSGEGTSKTGNSDIELDSGDSDFVLADAGGSDLSLDTADSGINLVDPSDSGLALDDIPLEMGGSAILDSLSLGGEGSDAELSLLGGDSNVTADDSFAELQTDDDFQLTPMGEGEDADDDSSSQVIALDEGLGDLEGAVLVEEEGGGDDDLSDNVLGDAVLDDGDFLEDAGEAMVLADGGDALPQESATKTVSVEDYTVGNILLMGSCVLLLMIGSSMMIDMVRSIWSWEQPYALNSTILEGLMGIFKLN